MEHWIFMKSKKGFVVIEQPTQICFVLEVEYVGKMGLSLDGVIVKGKNGELFQSDNFYGNKEEALGVAMRSNGNRVEQYQRIARDIEKRVAILEKDFSSLVAMFGEPKHTPTKKSVFDDVVYLLKRKA